MEDFKKALKACVEKNSKDRSLQKSDDELFYEEFQSVNLGENFF